ncbi:MAG: tRNA (adenosine(37)-N6)-dimethylallyltransferase MiaA [Verrucomicrobia bacterium]|nr:tRNA (adenosine(37)-N6)-dimethylallyltransferase MiaA [Verrucomicrobiota bacterium]
MLLTPFPQKKKIPAPSQKKKVILIAGPTAVGKTRLSLIVAKAIGGEIISADSMQVYRGMDIGTAKASLEERRQIPHHLIDSRDLDESFNVVEFYEEAMHAMKEIFDKGGVPIIVGGTGFYIHSLIYGPPSGPPSEPELRKSLEAEMKEKGTAVLYERLRVLDPEYAKAITQNDRHKIIRGLEIISLANQKVSELSSVTSENLDLFDFRSWFIHIPREILYQKIEMRCDEMIAAGFVDEVKRLEKEGLRSNRTACQAIGYRQCLDYLDSAQTQEDWDRFIAAFKQASRNLAKRQFTWFKREPLFRWLDLQKVPLETAAEMIIQDYELSF